MGIIAGAVMAGVSVLGSISKQRSEHQQGKATAKAMEEANKREWEAKLVNAREQYAQLSQVEQQYNSEFHQNLIQNQTSLMQQQASLEAMAGATGTGGQSINTLMTDLVAQGGRNQSAIVSNFENQQISIANQARAIQTGNQQTDRVVNKPKFDLGESVLKTTSAGVQGFMGGSNMWSSFSKSLNDYRSNSSQAGAKIA